MALWFQHVLLPEGWAERVRVTTEHERIAAVVCDADAQLGDECHGVALPGLCNVHSHAFQRAMAGHTETRGSDGDDFWSWREVMYSYANRIGPPGLRAIAALAFVEMIESGFTRAGEFHYLHHDCNGQSFSDPAEMGAQLLAAAEETGMNLTLLPVLYTASGFGGRTPRAEQRRFITDLDRYEAIWSATRQAAAHAPQSIVGVAIHSLRAVTPAALDAALSLDAAAPIHIHIAEQVQEVDDCIAWSGRRPIEWLFENVNVDARWCLVHATHANETEIALLAGSRAVVGLCPVTEANLGDGIFAARSYVRARGRFGIGTDSNVFIDAFAELRALEYSQRLSLRIRNALAETPLYSTGRTIFDGALAGGAQALGVEADRIATGSPANLWTLNLAHPALCDKQGNRLLDALIFSGSASMVDCVWINGRQRVRGGRHVGRDDIERRYRAVVQELVL